MGKDGERIPSNLQNGTPLISFVIAGQGREKHMLSVLFKKSYLTDSMAIAGGTRHKTNYSQGEIEHSVLKEYNTTLNKHAFQTLKPFVLQTTCFLVSVKHLVLAILF